MPRMIVTPEMANKWLEHNPDNRPISERVVKRYCDLIRNGKWVLTNDSITIANDGSLSNGQHRLTAIAKTGIPCECLVEFGIDGNEYMDSGKKRTVKDRAKMAGYSGLSINASKKNALINYAFEIIQGRKPSCSTEIYKINEYYMRHVDSIDFVVGLITHDKNIKNMQNSAVSLSMYAAVEAGENTEKVKEWYKILISGVYDTYDNLQAAKSVLLCRNYFIKNNRNGDRNFRDYTLKVCMNSIFCYCSGKAIKTLRPSDVYSIPE